MRSERFRLEGDAVDAMWLRPPRSCSASGPRSTTVGPPGSRSPRRGLTLRARATATRTPSGRSLVLPRHL